MISKSHRFHGYGALNPVYKHGKTVRAPNLTLKFVRNEKTRTYRLAVVVSKKVHKSAVVRNRIKRRIYETYRSFEPEIKNPYDLVCTAFHEDIANLESSQLTQSVRKLLEAADLLESTDKT